MSGRRHVVLPVPGGHLPWRHTRFLPVHQAKHRLGKAVFGQDAGSTAQGGTPRAINTDKNAALAAAITELKTEGRCPTSVTHRRVKHLNNRIEGDHGRLTRILSPKCGFTTPVSAYRTLKGMEAMHALRKGQGHSFAYGRSNPDAVIVEKAFAST